MLNLAASNRQQCKSNETINLIRLLVHGVLSSDIEAEDMLFGEQNYAKECCLKVADYPLS